ncbi:MAG: hypothetical protein IT289_08940 [Oligoflexia bacterium]|nr:hypothetical protein [Oligoflexia bacterium]
MKSLLVSVLMVQFSFGQVAWAQSSEPPPYSKEIFWSQSGVDPNQPSSWYNNAQATGTKMPVASSQNPAPWSFSSNDPVWDPSGPGGGNGGWGDPSTDPFGVYSQYTVNGIATVRPTDSIWTKLIRYTGVLTKDYTRLVQESRSRNGYEDDDTLADNLISSASKKAAAIGAAGAVITSLIVKKNDNGTGIPDPGGIGMGYGDLLAALGIPMEAAALMIIQMSAVMQMASIYGELPPDDDDRVDLASIPFAMSLTSTAASRFVTEKIISGIGTRIAAQEVAALAAKNVGAKIAVESGAETVGIAVAAQAAAATAASTATGATSGWFSRYVTAAMPFIKVGVKAGAGAAISGVTTRILLNKAKKLYRTMAAARKAKVILAVRSEPKAKQAVWLLLTRHVFPTMVKANPKSLEDTRMYAAVVDQMMPLVRNGKWDELRAMNEDYRSRVIKSEDGTQARSVLIDEYLLALGKDLDLHARLYLVKLVLGGMLMKGGLEYADNQVLETMGVELMLYPPPKVSFAMFRPNDPRLDARGRFLQLKQEMQQSVAKAEALRAEAQAASGKKTNVVVAKRGRAGQIIFEDWYQSEKVVNLCEDQNSPDRVNDCITKEIMKKENQPSKPVASPSPSWPEVDKR